ncbi:CypX Cytochrome P450 [Pyrenophora tritici-repentis]|uniref:Cytochrome P450 n=2 Tax=Pyrenophora tritici-repentis TaxID=45151 RepID=A0A2W1F1C8_9PLEO|nr:cytochrome P450 6A1 [Pyrenophora tritici-repentis Pt-1C-BFP]KAA8626508.1 Cytochrome P450 [Pyrenophora tritici-repentis]EDU41243.1 cytochrome P450 6A1 [Pyrenophora tritici-repentis Pt-1C-BFP]KAF7454934.1 Cytochrome P450 [Pyrenophora tritici-repentis]KAF7578079.1 CypX, Cytochrome P450 [Pyrenophora tritici-repentis]KAG9388693.1 Cytochrome P450 [Pyrenophora tritici-repentis]
MALPGVIGDFAEPKTLLLFLLSFVVLYTCAILYQSYAHKIPANSPPQVDDDLPITGASGWFTRRWDWCQEKRDRSKTGNFSFHAGSRLVIGLCGENGRRTFFESKGLSFTKGYDVLFGGGPNSSTRAQIRSDPDLTPWFNRQIVNLLKSDHLQKRLATLISDTKDGIEAIKQDPSGCTDPFTSIYNIVFRLTIRTLGANEIVENEGLLEAFAKNFGIIDKSSNATTICFPKFPSPSLLKRYFAGAQLFSIVAKIIKTRETTGKKYDDALQFLQDQGSSTLDIVRFILAALFAGVLNSGINAAWVLIYLATSPEWQKKVRDEVCGVAAKYAKDPNMPLVRQLEDVPLEAWESEFPIIEMCLRDSMRLGISSNLFRRNISGKPIPTGNNNEVIPPGAVAVYPVGDIHFDHEVYPDPYKWDPSRYLPEHAQDTKAHDFVGWGSGRHPCLGMRFAKLEQNLITAFFVTNFNFDLEDKQGNKVTTPPAINVNDHFPSKPALSHFIRVTPREK